jgi:hypothetical protein
MTKIKLSLENLRVESFTTCAADGGLGTVHANAKTVDACVPTYYGNGACSVDDGCASSPHALSSPCAGCVETADPEFCVSDVGELAVP